VGVKCLHAHVAYLLAGGDDPVGRWAIDRLVQPATDTDTRVTSPGTLTITVDDHALVVDVTGGGGHTVPVGPLTLLAGPLNGGDPPAPADLTNALGLVHDHLDDLLIEAPSIAAAPAVILVGRHAEAMALVEIGTHLLPAGYELRRPDADEVFRTLAVESLADRRHNPGLPDEHAESIIATCCVILGIMRRLDLRTVGIGGQPATRLDNATTQAAH
jgi:exopolyphosphatase/guanosine-5'-triphosphate,3'-diphosphate pyrophosphatase